MEKMEYLDLRVLFARRLLTLGFYDIFWLARTRNQIVRTYNISLPSHFWLIAGRAVVGVAAICVIAIVLVGIPKVNSYTTDTQPPSGECFYEYGESKDFEARSDVSQVCQGQVDGYYDQAVRGGNIMLGFMIFIITFFICAPILNIFFIKKWLEPYAAAVEKITGGRLSAQEVIAIIEINNKLFSFSKIQEEFNKLSDRPAGIM